MDELGNTLEDLLNEQQLEEYRSKEYPFNTNFLGTILKEKLKEDPDYEVWVPFFYCKYALRRKDRNAPSVIYSPLTFISNKGKVVKLREGKYISGPNDITWNGYLRGSSRTTSRTKLQFMIHRAMASVFTPVPDELKLFHPKDLQVNHIDGVKTNFDLSNLEWVTDLGNKVHAVSTGLVNVGKNHYQTKPVVGTILTGSNAGYKFILYGQTDYKLNGFTQPNIVACLKGRYKSHKNCSWAYATPEDIEEIPRGTPEILGTFLS